MLIQDIHDSWNSPILLEASVINILLSVICPAYVYFLLIFFYIDWYNIDEISK